MKADRRREGFGWGTTGRVLPLGSILTIEKGKKRDGPAKRWDCAGPWSQKKDPSGWLGSSIGPLPEFLPQPVRFEGSIRIIRVEPRRLSARSTRPNDPPEDFVFPKSSRRTWGFSPPADRQSASFLDLRSSGGLGSRGSRCGRGSGSGGRSSFSRGGGSRLQLGRSGRRRGSRRASRLAGRGSFTNRFADRLTGGGTTLVLLLEELQPALLLPTSGLARRGSLANRLTDRLANGFADRLTNRGGLASGLAMPNLPTLSKTPDTSCQGQNEDDRIRHGRTP
jgi:hypothetical protein